MRLLTMALPGPAMPALLVGRKGKAPPVKREAGSR
jgi:hypothetical protein